MESNTHIATLIAKFLNGTITPPEQQELGRWLEASQNNQRLFNRLTDPSYIEGVKQIKARDKAAELQKITDEFDIETDVQPKSWPSWLKYSIAACITLSVGAIVYFIVIPGFKKNKQVAEKPKVDFQPGSSGATLILTDGSARHLDLTSKANIPVQGLNKVTWDTSGILKYEFANHNKVPDPSLTNSLITSNGETLLAILPDGSKAWMNAASAFSFPVSPLRRGASFIGEGYFEIAQAYDPQHNKIPYRLIINGTEVLVHGTKFNVNSYKGETEITLLEGSVSVTPTQADSATKIEPGQLARISPNGHVRVSEAENIPDIVAWKNGKFQYNDAPLHIIMRDLQRWYKVKTINFQIDSTRIFTASSIKQVPVTDFLKKIEAGGHVHFIIEPDSITATE